jgi:hypothetical protein
VTVKYLLGHVQGDTLGEHYVEVIEDENLQHVADYVRKWLYGTDS